MSDAKEFGWLLWCQVWGWVCSSPLGLPEYWPHVTMGPRRVVARAGEVGLLTPQEVAFLSEGLPDEVVTQLPAFGRHWPPLMSTDSLPIDVPDLSRPRRSLGWSGVSTTRDTLPRLRDPDEELYQGIFRGGFAPPLFDEDEEG